MRWLLTQGRARGHQSFRGAAASSAAAPAIRYPDIQYHFLPMAVSYDGSSLAQEHGFQAHVGPMRSKSRGWVRLASADPHGQAADLLQLPVASRTIWVEMRACVRLTREIFAQPAFDRYRGPGDPAGRAMCRRTSRSMPSSAARSRAPITRPAPARWATPTTRWRWSIRETRVTGTGGFAGGRFLDHAVDHHRQSQRADDHAGGGCRPLEHLIGIAPGTGEPVLVGVPSDPCSTSPSG